MFFGFYALLAERFVYLYGTYCYEGHGVMFLNSSQRLRRPLFTYLGYKKIPLRFYAFCYALFGYAVFS